MSDPVEVVCPTCNRPVLDFEIGNHRDDRPKCAPTTCSRWKIVGMSRGGSPLLRIVEPQEDTPDA